MCHFSTYFAIIIYFLKINSWKGKKGESKAGWGAPSTPGLRATLCNILFDWTIIIFSQHFIISIQLVDVVIYNMSLIPIHEAFNIALRVPPKVGRFGLPLLLQSNKKWRQPSCCKYCYPKGFTKIWVRRDFGLYIARPKIDQSEFCNSTIFSVH